ncbi:acid-sensing ion channel 1-like [Babylonia areolata]|uniref:acid-sensing ion channel 1-like n=1 Tax=Babylonia areolata TaxID=304850 RepID=UPI003FD68B37
MRPQEEEETMKTEPPPVSKELADKTTTFMSETSLHGVKNVSQTERHRISRVSWLLAVLGMTCWLMYALTHQFMRYSDYPHTTSFQLTESKFSPLPAVSVCLKDPLDSQRLQQALPEPHLVIQFLKDRTNLNWSDPHVQQAMSNVTLQQVMDVASFSAREVVVSASTLLTSFNINEDIVTVDVLNDFPQRCYTFKGTKGKPFIEHSLGRLVKDSFTLYLRVPQATIIPFDEVGGVVVSIHNQGELFPGTDRTDAAFGTSVSVKFSATKFDFLPSPYNSMEGQNCLDLNTDSQPPFTPYSFASCVWKRMNDPTTSACGCRTLGDDENVDLPNCTLLQMHECFLPALSLAAVAELASSPCLSECQMTRLETKVSSVPFTAERMAQLPMDINLTSVDFLKIFVQFESDKILTIKHVPAMTLHDIYSDVGGQMGLFLGASLLTVAEVMEYVISLLWISARRLCCKAKAVTSS